MHVLQLMPFTIFPLSFHQVPISAGWTEAVRHERIFAQYLYTSIYFSDLWELVNLPCARDSVTCRWPTVKGYIGNSFVNK